MNYRRGLFRLWVILTVLWVGGIAISVWQYASAEYRSIADYQAAYAKMGPWERHRDPVSLAQMNDREMIARYDYLKGDRAPEFNPSPWLVEGAGVALLPPLALLALGTVLGWAFSGFRHAK